MSNRLYQIGWCVAASLLAVLLVSGFQNTTEKTGVVDVQKLVTTSEFGKSSQASIDKLSSTRKETLQFVGENPCMTVEEAQSFHELSVKTTLTTDEQAKLATVRKSASDNTKKLTDLMAKTTPSTDEKALISDLTDRANKTRNAAGQWAQDFQQEIQQYGEGQYAATMDRVQSSLQDTAKAQGFTAIFDKRYAPYGTSDITDACLAAMNARK